MRHTRHAFRALRQSGVSSLVTATILALGIGANSAIFSIVNGWLFRPLPVEQPKQLVVLASQRAGAADLGGLSYPDFLDYRSQVAAFQDALAYSMGFAGLRTYARTERILVNYVSANYFAMLAVRPAEGRLILPSDGDSPGASDVVVLGYSYWQSRLKADPHVIGASFLLDGHAVTVCGIAAPEFRGLHAFLDVQAYVPVGMLATHPGGKSLWTDRSNRMLSVMARLREGTSLDMANAALAVVAPRLAQDHPEADKGVSVRAFAERLSRPEPSTASVAPMIAITFMALASALLLLTCFNVANVLLIRANARQTSIALRVALGARARDVIAQVLSEGMLLAILGGLGAMAIAEVLCSSLASIGGHLDLAMTFDFRPDWRVFTYAFIMTLLAGVAVSAFPAMRALRADLNAVTREGGAGLSAGRSRRKLANIIVAAQVAGCLVLLIGAGLFIRSLSGANRMHLGFNPKSVVNASMDPSQLGYDAARTARFYRELLYAVRHLPGVENASLAFSVPFGFRNTSADIVVPGSESGSREQASEVFYNIVSPAYFETLQIPRVLGRTFTEQDTEETTPVAVVDEAMARRWWPNEEAIGKSFAFKGTPGRILTVVGVVKDGKYLTPADRNLPYFYLALRQSPKPNLTLQVRSRVAPYAVIAEIQKKVAGLEPALPVFDAMTMMDVFLGANGIFPLRVAAAVASAFGGLGLVLAVVGLYGIVSDSVNQRRREISIRMAVGASSGDIVRMVLRQGLLIVVIGIVAGAAVAALMAKALSPLLLGVSAFDALTFAGIPLLQSLVAIGACLIPAARAVRTQASQILHAQ
jgi:macrolide transport system ATP-binding/permease protein